MKKKIAFGPGKQVSAFEAENKNSKSNNVISSLHLTRSPHLCWMPRPRNASLFSMPYQRGFHEIQLFHVIPYLKSHP